MAEVRLEARRRADDERPSGRVAWVRPRVMRSAWRERELAGSPLDDRVADLEGQLAFEDVDGRPPVRGADVVPGAGELVAELEREFALQDVEDLVEGVMVQRRATPP